MARDMLSDSELKISIADQVDAEVKTGVLEIYEDLLRTIWAKIVPTLGTVTVITIVKRAINRTGANHPILTDLAVGETGLGFDKIKEKIGHEDKQELNSAFKELVVNLFEILAKLTGDILVQQLMQEVEGLEIN